MTSLLNFSDDVEHISKSGFCYFLLTVVNPLSNLGIVGVFYFKPWLFYSGKEIFLVDTKVRMNAYGL